MTLAPPPSRLNDMGRVDELRLRLRLFRGEHQADVETALTAMFGLERAEKMKKSVDLAADAFSQLYTTLAALYNFTPRTAGPSQRTLDAVEIAGHWTAMIRNQRDTLGLGDLAVVLAEDEGTLQFRAVTPDCWYDMRARVKNPKELAYFAFWLQSGEAWELHEYQIENALGQSEAWHRVRPASEVTMPGFIPAAPESGAYAWLDGKGKPYMPVVLYHAADTGRLMDWASGRNVTRGCVRLMVYYTDLGHLISETAWQQRVIIDGRVDSGAEVDVVTGAQTIVADPASVLSVKSDEGKQAVVTAFPRSADPEGLFRVIAMYARQVASLAGVRTPDATRSESDIRSGYSLAVSRESIAEQQAIYAPMFQRADQELLHKCALLLGEATEGPQSWSIEYQAVELGPVELAARIAAIKELRSLGLISDRSAMFMLHPGWTLRQVDAELARVLIEHVDAEPAPVPGEPAANTPTITLAPTDLATIVTVDEGRASAGLPPLGGSDGGLTIVAFKAKYANTVAAAASATAGSPAPTPPAEPAEEAA